MRVARILLAVAAVICGLGATAHAGAYRSAAAPALENAHLAPFLGAELRVLWLADSTTLFGLCLLFGYLAARPRSASGVVVILASLVPGATAVLLYLFLGGFYAAHLLIAATASAAVAGILLVVANASERRAGQGE
jgi:hypothetical protein